MILTLALMMGMQTQTAIQFPIILDPAGYVCFNNPNECTPYYTRTFEANAAWDFYHAHRCSKHPSPGEVCYIIHHQKIARGIDPNIKVRGATDVFAYAYCGQPSGQDEGLKPCHKEKPRRSKGGKRIGGVR